MGEEAMRIECRGRTIEDQSLSHWGQFPIGGQMKYFWAEDLALDPVANEYVSVVVIGDDRHEIRTSRDEVMDKGVDVRMNNELAVIRAMGIDTSTFQIKYEGHWM